jgi:esterase FrsA
MNRMRSDTAIAALNVAPDVTLYHRGPALDHGPLPSLFYFALSGPDSLQLDPFNQPVQFLRGQMIRVFSLTLPGHESHLPPTEALNIWAEDIQKGLDPIGRFLDQAETAIEFAIRERFVDPNRLALAGLSRGAFIAAHLAARLEKVRFLLGFAPLTKLRYAKEFATLQEDPRVQSLDLENLVPQLSSKHVRLFIGNQDTRVQTRSCLDFAMALADHASENRIRSPQIELILYPSIGHAGHGTPPEIFRQGVNWLTDSLK